MINSTKKLEMLTMNTLKPNLINSKISGRHDASEKLLVGCEATWRMEQYCFHREMPCGIKALDWQNVPLPVLWCQNVHRLAILCLCLVFSLVCVCVCVCLCVSVCVSVCVCSLPDYLGSWFMQITITCLPSCSPLLRLFCGSSSTSWYLVVSVVVQYCSPSLWYSVSFLAVLCVPVSFVVILCLMRPEISTRLPFCLLSNPWATCSHGQWLVIHPPCSSWSGHSSPPSCRQPQPSSSLLIPPLFPLFFQ